MNTINRLLCRLLGHVLARGSVRHDATRLHRDWFCLRGGCNYRYTTTEPARRVTTSNRAAGQMVSSSNRRDG